MCLGFDLIFFKSCVAVHVLMMIWFRIVFAVYEFYPFKTSYRYYGGRLISL